MRLLREFHRKNKTDRERERERVTEMEKIDEKIRCTTHLIFNQKYT